MDNQNYLLTGYPDESKYRIEEFFESSRIQYILDLTLKKYLQVTDITQFPSPFELKNMREAVGLFIETVNNGGIIKWIIDSDCDGISAYTMIYKFYQKFFSYKDIKLIITNRKEGYGFIPNHIEENVDLYITADNGITSNSACKLAKEKGQNVIITDHHRPDLAIGLPDADYIIDPYLPDDTFKYKDISGTFVTFLFLQAISETYKLEHDLYKEFLPELAITAISDVMPLHHLNRYVVRDFLSNLHTTQNRSYLNVFLNKNNVKTAEDLAFGLIPQINASQRIAKADYAAIMMISEDEETAEKWLDYLKKLNDSRKERQATLVKYIEDHYSEFLKNSFIIIPGKFQEEYKGVLGIIAGKLAEKYNKPAIVLTYKSDVKEYFGSGRTVGDINLLELVKDPLLKSVGGHKQALGVTISEKNFNQWYLNLQEKTKEIPSYKINPLKLPLGFIKINLIDKDLYDNINKYEPFGQKFPRPTLVTIGIIKKVSTMGKLRNHLSLNITDENNIINIRGVKFFTEDNIKEGEKYEIQFKLSLDSYNKKDDIMLNITGLKLL